MTCLVRSVVSRRDAAALLAAVTVPLIVTAALVPARSKFANTDAALVLVAVVVAVAAFGNRMAGYFAAIVSAAAFDFFLTKPFEHFTITRRSDVQTTVLLMVIGIAVTEIAVWGRRQQSAATRRASYLSDMYTAAEAAVRGGTPNAMIGTVTDQLITLLDLETCHFQRGLGGIGELARLHHDGHVTAGGHDWPVDAVGLPTGVPIEFVVAHHALIQGRFLMTAKAGARPPLESRLVAAALADQCSAVLVQADAA